MKAVLLYDVYSYTRGLYGRAGEEVTIIADHDLVLIVEGQTGSRFPIARDKVTIKEGE